MFKEIGFQLEIKTNLKQVEFLDATFNLITGLYTPFKKPNDNLLYINTSSDHPPQVIKQLTNSINKRLCENSSNKQVSKTVKPVYENPLHKGGYKCSLKYSEEIYQHSSNNLSSLIHHLPKPLKLMLQNCSSDYWINISQSLTYYTKSLTETPSHYKE